MNESVDKEALVMPSSTSKFAGQLALGRTRSFSASSSARSTCSGLDELGIARFDDGHRRSIWRTITSMCLSLIFTPCSR